MAKKSHPQKHLNQVSTTYVNQIPSMQPQVHVTKKWKQLQQASPKYAQPTLIAKVATAHKDHVNVQLTIKVHNIAVDSLEI